MGSKRTQVGADVSRETQEEPEKSMFHVKHGDENGNKVPHFWRFLGLERPL